MTASGAAAARLFPLVPQRFARHLAAHYIAGPTVEEAVAVAVRLRKRRILATLAVLGESVESNEQAAAFAREYVRTLAALEAAELEPHVSVKPSALGSHLNWGICEQHLLEIARAASSRGGTMCVDMESAHTIEGTLEQYRRLRQRHFHNVTIVAQARLHRTRDDLLELGGLVPSVRICKGIYPEPPQIAYADQDAIRRNYIFCLDTLLESGGYAAVATHDEALIVAALERIAFYGRLRETYEFQLLLGVRDDLADALAGAGHKVRVYVPYGRDWHKYAARRLRESPHVSGYVARDLGKRLATQVGRWRNPPSSSR